MLYNPDVGTKKNKMQSCLDPGRGHRAHNTVFGRDLSSTRCNMDSSESKSRFDKCETRSDLRAEIGKAIRDPGAYLPMPIELQGHISFLPGGWNHFDSKDSCFDVGNIYTAAKRAAILIWQAEGAADVPPLDAADPLDGLAKILQWCENASEAESAQSDHDEPTASPDEPLSTPQSKSKIMATVGIDSPRKFAAWSEGKLKQVADNRQLWQVRLNLCATNERAKLQKM